MRTLAILLAVTAVILMMMAIVGMVTGRPAARAGLLIRVGAVVCFGAAVALNVAAH